MNLKGKRVRITNGQNRGRPSAQQPIGTFDIAAWSLVQAGNGVGWSYALLCVNVQTGEIDQFALGEVTIEIIASAPTVERKEVTRPFCCARFAWGDGTHEPRCKNFRGAEAETAAAAGDGRYTLAEFTAALEAKRGACADPTCPGDHGKPTMAVQCTMSSAFGQRCILIEGHPADSPTRFHRFVSSGNQPGSYRSDIVWTDHSIGSNNVAEQSELIAAPAETPDLGAALAKTAEERDAARRETESIRSAYESVTREADRRIKDLTRTITNLTATPAVMPSLTEGTEERDGRLYYKSGGEEVKSFIDGAAYKEWAARLVAERNEARRCCYELQRRIDAFTLTGSVQPGDLYRRS